MSILVVKELTKIYGSKDMQQEVLRGINLSVDEGEFVSIMGPSGSGKTTLLNILGSIDYMSQGSVELAGHKLEKCRIKRYLICVSGILGLFFKIIIYYIH